VRIKLVRTLNLADHSTGPQQNTPRRFQRNLGAYVECFSEELAGQYELFLPESDSYACSIVMLHARGGLLMNLTFNE
jgi:hypothetical protein